jgi:hypothetical protein
VRRFIEDDGSTTVLALLLVQRSYNISCRGASSPIRKCFSKRWPIFCANKRSSFAAPTSTTAPKPEDALAILKYHVTLNYSADLLKKFSTRDKQNNGYVKIEVVDEPIIEEQNTEH